MNILLSNEQKEHIQEEIVKLQQQREELVSQVHALGGAIQTLEQLLNN